ncbi:alpha/beta hydrolase [Pseudomonas canadensis]|uniref:alpha/beta hydrolase n=1 Tax=Pseudomonas canadensis TaxID=915099 RepID=UPI0030D19A24
MSKAPRLTLLTLLATLAVMLPLASWYLSVYVDEQPAGVRWQPCVNSEFATWFDDQPPQGMLCGYVEAPLIYSASAQAGSVRLALTRLPAKGVRKGSVVVVSGGPGLPGINPYLSGDSTVDRLKQSYDIIGYDPRGVGRSTPTISCKRSDHDEDVTVEGSDKAESEFQLRRTIAECIKQTGALVLQHIGTNEAVNDLNVIRAALGEPKLTAVAYSYGTQVAALFAERFPEQTRAMVLDGVVDLSEDEYTQQLNQARSYQQTFQRFLAYCAQTRDCPLPGDERGAVEAFQTILRDVDESPLPLKDGNEMTAEDLVSTVQSMLLWYEFWPDLIALLRQTQTKNADEQLAQLVTDHAGRETNEALGVITCADIAVPGSDIQEIRKQRQAIVAASPLFNYLGKQNLPLSMCDLWPFQGKVQAHIPVVSLTLPPLLFVGQRYDATTPYANARQMAKWFRSPLVTREGDGHTLALTGTDGCVDEAVVDYLLTPNAGVLDKTCP